MSLAHRYPRRIYARRPLALPLMDEWSPYALRLDGSTGYIRVPTSPSLDIVNNMTIEIWVKRQSSQVLVREYLIHAGLLHYRICSLASGGIRCYWDGAHSLWTSPFTVQRWTRITLTLASTDGLNTNAEILLNGRSVVKKTDLGVVNTTGQNFYIGVLSPPNYFFNGFSGEIHIYNRVLPLAESQRNMRNPLNPIRNGLALWFPLLAGSGGTVVDHSGNGNDGTIFGGVSWRDLAKYEPQAEVV